MRCLFSRLEDLSERIDLKVFARQHPYHKDLDFIDGSREKVYVGDKRFQISGRRAGYLAKIGLVNIIDGSFGKYLELTMMGSIVTGKPSHDSHQ